MKNTFQVSLGDFEQLTVGDQTGAVLGLIGMFNNLNHCRHYSFVTPTNLDALVDERTHIAANAAHPWQRRGIQEEIRHIREVNKRDRLQRITHYMTTDEEYIAASDLGNWGVMARAAKPDMPFVGQYREELDHLVPVYQLSRQYQQDYSRPYICVLGSCELKGNWTLRKPLVDMLLDANGSMAVCIETQKVRPERIELTTNSLTALVNEGKRGVKQDDIKQLEAARFCLNHDSETTHFARVIIVLMNSDLQALKKERTQLVRKLSPYIRLDKYTGYQSAGLEYFKSGKRKMALPKGDHPILASGIASMTSLWGFGLERPNEGIYVGQRLSFYKSGFRGIYYMKGWDDQKAHHANFFGKTGTGKSTNVRAMLHREAEQGTQIIVLDPQPHVKKFAALFDEETMDSHLVGSSNLTFNPLDVVWDNFSQQADHVRAILKIMLNPDGDTPRSFSTLEVAAIEEALKCTYEFLSWEELLNDQGITPTLEIFCKHLEVCGPEAKRLAHEIYTLYVAGERSKVFNAASTLDTRLKKLVCIYDFSPIFDSAGTGGMEGLFYYIVLSAIYREVRQNPNRRQIIFIDEFGAMMREPSLVKALAIMYKTFRTFKAGIWVADQNPFTLAGISSFSGGGGDDLDQRLSILRNTPRTFAFGLDTSDAEQLREIYPQQIQQSHVQFLAGADRGQAVIRADGEGTEMVYFSLKPSEVEHLIGS
jgi:hypothetical protein